MGITISPSPIHAADEQGAMYVEGALVHYIKPEGRQYDNPIIMIPGLNLSSYIFLTTPDGREGWAQQFAAAGYDVYVINDPRFDFSRGFNVEGFEKVPEEGAPPADSTAVQGWQQDIWRRWGFGSAEDDPYPDAQFPTDDFDEFVANYPYLSRSNASYADAIAALLEQTGPAILMPHSAGGPQAVRAALEKPDQVTGFVLVEPTGPPTESEFPALAGKFMLGVYGDYIDSRRQAGRKAGVEAAAVLFSQNGGPAEVISMPEDHRVNGNSHLMMEDENNADIADLIIDWLADPQDNPGDGGDGGGTTSGRPGRGGGGKGMKGGGKGGKGGASMSGAAFSQLDTNEDKVLSEREFGKSRRYARAGSDEVEKAFKAADENDDGLMNPEEFEKAYSAAGRGGKGGGKGKGKGGGRN